MRGVGLNPREQPFRLRLENRGATGTTEDTAPLVCLCHASEDEVAVRSYAARLADTRFATWLQEEQLLLGQ